MLDRHDTRQPLDAVDVCMLDRHETRVCKELLRKVVDKLAVDEAVDAVLSDLLALLAHFIPLRLLDLSHLAQRVDPHPRPVNLDLVRIHRGVSQQDLCILDALRLPNPNLLVQDEALSKVGAANRAARNLDDLYMVQVVATLESQDGVDGQLCEVTLLVRQKLGAESGHRDVHQVLFECIRVRGVVLSCCSKRRTRSLQSDTPAGDDGLWVDPLRNKLLCLAEQLTRKNCNTRRAVAHLVVLYPSNVDEHL